MPPAMLGQIIMPPIGLDQKSAVWPETPDSQWCGHFELSTEKWKQEYERAGRAVEPSAELREDAAPFREAVGQFIRDEFKRTFVSNDEKPAGEK
jgi:hypothetical protein